MSAISPASAALPSQAVPTAYPQAMTYPQGPVPQSAVPQSAVPQAGVGNGVTPIVVTDPSQLPAGVMPISQAMLAQATGQGQIGAQAVQPPSSAGTVIGNLLKGAAMGGAAGFAFGFLPLPGGKLLSAGIGAAIGGALGVVRGVSQAKRHTAEYASMQQLLAQQQQGATVGTAQGVAGGVDPTAAISPANPTSRAAQKRRMDARRAEIRAELAAKKQAAKH